MFVKLLQFGSYLCTSELENKNEFYVPKSRKAKKQNHH